MKTTLQSLQESISNAVDMIDQSQLVSDDLLLQQPTKYSTNSLDFTNANSLLDRCDQVNTEYKNTKPDIRIVHHLACSGGTLISKCISAMPNVFLLSEVHPHSDLQRNKDKAQYSPSDLAKLAIYAGVPAQKELAEKIFVESVKINHQHISERGGTLILRDHTHSDYCVGEDVSENIVAELLKEYFNIQSLVTLRNPIDSYLSLVDNGWVHFQPATFDEYCARLLAFLASFSKEQIVFYEDFVQQPQQVVQQMCSILQIPFDDTFETVFDVFSVTGDSGRKGAVISTRERRKVTQLFKEEIENSANFKKVCQLYSLNPVVD